MRLKAGSGSHGTSVDHLAWAKRGFTTRQTSPIVTKRAVNEVTERRSGEPARVALACPGAGARRINSLRVISMRFKSVLLSRETRVCLVGEMTARRGLA